jgi:hypothetical protein
VWLNSIPERGKNGLSSSGNPGNARAVSQDTIHSAAIALTVCLPLHDERHTVQNLPQESREVVSDSLAQLTVIISTLIIQ